MRSVGVTDDQLAAARRMGVPDFVEATFKILCDWIAPAQAMAAGASADGHLPAGGPSSSVPSSPSEQPQPSVPDGGDDAVPILGDVADVVPNGE